MASAASSGSGSGTGEKVQVYLYDLSQGVAAMVSQGFLGKKIDGIWHTGLIVYGTEYYYGGGIQWSAPGQSMAGKPMRIIDIGTTEITQDVFHEYLNSISSRFTPQTYSLLKHNCNNFSNECSQFLTGKPIPDYITGLPEDALNTPMGQMFKPMIENMEKQMRGGGGGGFIPWSEGGNLSLPPIRKAGARSAVASPATKPAAGAAAASAGGAADGKAAAAVVAVPVAGTAGAPQPVGLAESKHAHFALGCTAVTTASRANLSAGDKNVSTFLALIKQANKKVDAAVALSEEQLKSMADIAAALSSEGKDAAAATAAFSSSVAHSAFDLMLTQWSARQLFGSLGLFRLCAVKPEVYAFVESKAYPKDAKTGAQAVGAIAKLIEIVKPKADAKAADGKSAAEPVAAAVQIMALCTLSNLFGSPSLCLRLAGDESVVRCALHACRQTSDKSLRVAGGTLLYNCVLFTPKSTDSDLYVDALSQLSELIGAETDAEPECQLLYSIAHAVFGNSALAVILSALDVDFDAINNKFGASNVVGPKIRALTSDLKRIVAYEKEQQN